MSLVLQVSGVTERIAEIEFHKVQLLPAVDGVRLRLVGKIEPGNFPPAQIELLDLTAGISMSTAQNPFLCEAKPEIGANSIWFGQYTGRQQLILEGRISLGALESIEATRKGAPQFSVGLRGLVRLDRILPGQPPDLKQGPQGTFLVYSNPNIQKIDFSRSDWEDALESVGYGKFIRFDLSLPKALYSQAAQDAYRRLDEAQKLLRQGNHLEVIAICRRALANLGADADMGDKALFRKAIEDRDNLSEGERIALVRAAILALSQTGVHPEQIPGTTPSTYPKAAAIVYLTALTAWLEEQQREVKSLG